MSGKSYYTMKVDNAGRGGAVKIKDEKSGSIVTLQSSGVKTISEEEYEAAMVAKAPVQRLLYRQPRFGRPRLQRVLLKP